MLYLAFFIFVLFSFGKVYVVERETGNLAVIEKDKLKKEIKNLGNLNHATLKFKWGKGYLISRDGYVSLIDINKDELIKKVKAGNSAIGLNFCPDKVLIANYSPKNVVVLTKDLKIIKKINTGSRNVGIKAKGKIFLYALMDKDKVHVRDCESLKLLKEFKVGKMPFDALLYYVVGFFNEAGVGVVNLKKLTYKKVNFRAKGREVVLKIPHFGLWGVWKGEAYIPAVGERKVYIVDLKNFELKGEIPLKGLPVFVAVSPDGKYIGVNYSGDSEDYFTLIDRERKKVIKTKKLGKRILHFRFTRDGKYVYLSSYFENKVKKVSVPDLRVVKELDVPTPSGVFIYGGE
ncbi:MAG: NirF protein [Aquifex sp.]|nr:MAG: NirF protein [Aquifex sp.]